MLETVTSPLRAWLSGAARPNPAPAPPALVSARGLRVRVEARAGGVALGLGVPRRGCGGSDPTTLADAAFDTLVLLARSLRAEGARVAGLPARNIGPAPGDRLLVHGGAAPAELAGRAAALFDRLVADRLAALRLSPRSVRGAELEEVVAEARRQEAFQMPRVTGMLAGQTQESALRWAAGTTRLVREEGVAGGGYLLVDAPLPWLRVSPVHVSEERLARLARIGGTSDPAFSTEWAYSDARDGAGAVGPSLRLLNGNNRVHFARSTGRSHFPVYVTRVAWAGLTGAVADARRLAGGAPCREEGPSAPP